MQGNDAAPSGTVESDMIGPDGIDAAAMDGPVGRPDQDDPVCVLGLEQPITKAAAPVRRRPRRLHLGVERAVQPGAQNVPEGDQIGMRGRLQCGPLLLVADSAVALELSSHEPTSKGLTGSKISRPEPSRRA